MILLSRRRWSKKTVLGVVKPLNPPVVTLALRELGLLMKKFFRRLVTHPYAFLWILNSSLSPFFSSDTGIFTFGILTPPPDLFVRVDVLPSAFTCLCSSPTS